MESLASRLLLTVLPAIAVAVLVHSAIIGESGLLRRHRMLVDVERAERRLALVEAENLRLEREVRQLRTDETTVRRAVAEELLLVPPGSVVYRFEE